MATLSLLSDTRGITSRRQPTEEANDEPANGHDAWSSRGQAILEKSECFNDQYLSMMRTLRTSYVVMPVIILCYLVSCWLHPKIINPIGS